MGVDPLAATLTWLDHDTTDRDRMNRILALFRERDTRDELGTGVIRDLIADELFPGTSTIQTGYGGVAEERLRPKEKAVLEAKTIPTPRRHSASPRFSGGRSCSTCGKSSKLLSPNTCRNLLVVP